MRDTECLTQAPSTTQSCTYQHLEDNTPAPVQSEPHDPEPYVRLTAAALHTTDIPIYPLPPSTWNKNKDQPVNVFSLEPAKNLMATTTTERSQISMVTVYK